MTKNAVVRVPCWNHPPWLGGRYHNWESRKCSMKHWRSKCWAKHQHLTSTSICSLGQQGILDASNWLPIYHPTPSVRQEGLITTSPTPNQTTRWPSQPSAPCTSNHYQDMGNLSKLEEKYSKRLASTHFFWNERTTDPRGKKELLSLYQATN